MSRLAAGVHSEVNGDRDYQPAQASCYWQRQPPPLPQFAHVELASGLQAEDKEKERHQSAIHPLAQVQRHPAAGEPD